MALIMLQPDLGTVLVLVFIVLGVLACRARPPRWIGGLLRRRRAWSCVTAVQVGVLDDYQVDRFAAFANPELDPRGVGYNTNQARIAIGSGGLTRQGAVRGHADRRPLHPRAADRLRLHRRGGGARAARRLAAARAARRRCCGAGCGSPSRSPDPFGRLVAAGVVCWFAFQSFVNVGMTLGIMPVTGLPLPFVSYGGSAMFANLVAVGLLQNVHLSSREL